MQVQVVHLKELYSILGEENRDPVLTAILPYNLTEMKRQDMLRPAILLCPGGGYASVSQREDEPIALHFLPDGYNVFILRYSVKPNKFPVQIREVAAAVELIHSNCTQWHTDPNRIAIMGFSAGGHLACHYSNDFDCAQVREIFPESKPVQAAVLCYPVITADPKHAHKGSMERLSGHTELTQDDMNMFSLEKRVSPNTPPTFLWSTRTDQVVPIMNTLLYAQALAEQGTPFSVHIYPAGPHGLATCDEQTNGTLAPEVAYAADWIPQVKAWLKATL